ncbi:MAG: 3-dehydroquinate synthase family protein, partial [Kiloniellales bacterium]
MSVEVAERLTVSLGERSYEVAVGAGLIASAGEEIAALAPGQRTVVVTDSTVARLHLAALERSLDEAGIAYQALVVPPGEESKSFAELEALIDRLLEMKVDRGSLLVALGGGVVGDLTGFAAAVTLRGLDYVQIPTTLLAQVDSSVGGKTAINSRRGKNLIGAFHQPRLVLADTGALATL